MYSFVTLWCYYACAQYYIIFWTNRLCYCIVYNIIPKYFAASVINFHPSVTDQRKATKQVIIGGGGFETQGIE